MAASRISSRRSSAVLRSLPPLFRAPCFTLVSVYLLTNAVNPLNVAESGAHPARGGGGSVLPQKTAGPGVLPGPTPARRGPAGRVALAAGTAGAPFKAPVAGVGAKAGSLGIAAGAAGATGTGATGAGATGSTATGAGATGAGATGSTATGAGATGSTATGAGATGAGAMGSTATGAGATGAGATGSTATGSTTVCRATTSSSAAGLDEAALASRPALLRIRSLSGVAAGSATGAAATGVDRRVGAGSGSDDGWCVGAGEAARAN